jgi:hypothetical protein
LREILDADSSSLVGISNASVKKRRKKAIIEIHAIFDRNRIVIQYI